MENKKIDILLGENSNIRTELTAMIKNIHNCLFSFIGSLGLFVGVLLSLDKKEPHFDYNAGILAFLISQVGIIIILLAINIQADVFTKAAYIGYIEKKINNLIGEDIIFWESQISSREKKKSVMVSSQFFLFLSYFLSFVFLTIYSFNKLHNWLLLATQISEVITILFLSIQLNREFKNTNKYINSINF